MAAKARRAQLLELTRFGKTGMILKFQTDRPWSLHPGQYVSIVVPADASGRGVIKRCYSIASRAEDVRSSGIFELCVTQVPGGRATSYLSSLRPGNQIDFFGPYGDFFWDRVALEQTQDLFHQHQRTLDRLCFIGTGSGIAPLRSMLLGDAGLPSEVPETILLQGARSLSEIPYATDWRELLTTGHFQIKACLSEAPGSSQGAPSFLPVFPGRVTAYLEALPPNWGFEHTQFFICGSQAMLEQVRTHLTRIRGVSPFQIRFESFFVKQASARKDASAEIIDLQEARRKQAA